MTLKLLSFLVKEKLIIKSCLASLKPVNNSKDRSESYIITYVPAFFRCNWSLFFSESNAGFGTTFRATDGYMKDGTSFLRVYEQTSFYQENLAFCFQLCTLVTHFVGFLLLPWFSSSLVFSLTAE
jgi:hypothetical protein